MNNGFFYPIISESRKMERQNNETLDLVFEDDFSENDYKLFQFPNDLMNEIQQNDIKYSHDDPFFIFISK